MGIDYIFRYHPSPEEEPVVTEAISDGYVWLLDCPAEFLDLFHLWAPFVREYREKNPSPFDENVESTPKYEVSALYEIPDPEDIDWSQYEWQSSPFEPSDAREWAGLWIRMIETLLFLDNDDLLGAVFPYAVDEIGRVEFHKDFFIEDLRRVIAQADAAEKRGLKLTVAWDI